VTLLTHKGAPYLAVSRPVALQNTSWWGVTSSPRSQTFTPNVCRGTEGLLINSSQVPLLVHHSIALQSSGAQILDLLAHYTSDV
jgi:hypothetical protein